MSIKETLTNLFTGGVSTKRVTLEDYCYNLETSLSYRKLALEIASDLVGNTVAAVNWKEFTSGKRIKGETDYLLNISTNELQTSSEFFKQYVKKMFYDGEVLIIPDTTTGRLYIAEDFTQQTISRGKKIYHHVTYTDVPEMDERTYSNDEVIHIEYNKNNIRTFMNNYLNDYEKLISAAQSSYKANKKRRYVLSSRMFQAQTVEAQQEINELYTKNLADFAGGDKESSVYAKGDNWTVEDFSDKQIESAKDSRDLINDVFGVVAQTYHIPVQMILTGISGVTVTETIVENYLLNIVYPLIDLFAEGFNTYNYSKDEYFQGNKVLADKSKLRIANLQTLGTFIAAVYPTGALSLNDIVTDYLQMEELPAEIGNTRVITKNYATIEDFQKGLTAKLPMNRTNNNEGE